MKEVMKLLKENKQMNLATCYRGKPRSSIMEYIMVGDAMIFATNPISIKGKNLAKNPKVSVTVGGMPTFMAIDGTVEEPDEKQISAYNKELVKRYPHFKDMMASGAVKFKYFRVVFDTAYYTQGMGDTKIIKMK